jgi:hypothetical protein
MLAIVILDNEIQRVSPDPKVTSLQTCGII